MCVGIECHMRYSASTYANVLGCTQLTTHHLRFFLFLLYCSEETLLLFFFGWLRGIQDYSIWASPGNKTSVLIMVSQLKVLNSK